MINLQNGKVFILVFLMLASMGCVRIDLDNKRASDPQRQSYLKKGISKKKDVYIAFGQPHDVIYGQAGSQNSRWEYYKVKSTVSGKSFIPFAGLVVGGTNSKSTTAIIYFNTIDVLGEIEINERTKFINSWSSIAQGVQSDEIDPQATRVEQEMNKYRLPFDQVISYGAKNMKLHNE